MNKPNQSVLWRLLSYLFRYKGLTALALLFIGLTTLVRTSIPLVARYYIDHFVADKAAQAGLWLLAGYYGLFLLRVVFTYLGSYTFARVADSIVRDMRQEAFERIQRLGMSYYDKTPAGSIVSRVTNDTQAVADMFGTVFSSLLSSTFLFGATLLTMLQLNWRLTIYVLPFLPVIWGSIWLYRRLSTDLVRMTRSKLSDINVKLSESIEGMRIIQAFGQEGRLISEFEAVNQEHLQYANRTINVNSLFLRPAMSVLKILAYAVLLTYFGLNWRHATFTAGLMYAFIQYINQLFDPLIEVTQNFATLQTSMVSAQRVFELMDRTDFEPQQAADSPHAICCGDIAFEHVSFSYDGKRDVLKDISFTVKQGETIAFVGHTGSGKSSIINLFMRFYEFDRGRITIDGVDIRDYGQSELRKQVGLVLQDPFLYHGTIASNIRMHQELTEEEVEAAARFVDADSFIQELPLAYNNPVTERGTTLSSGQRQLIAFARTVAAQPKILILDEATANIDSETEEIIQTSLKKMRQGRTTIAIAHRLSTIQDASCIYVLDKGRIIEQGTHEELLALGGTYKKMYQLQAGMLENG